MLVPVLMYERETVVWKEKERFLIVAVQMDRFRGLLGLRRTGRRPVKIIVWRKESDG